MAGDSANTALEVGKLERLTGGTAQEMSVFRFAAQQTGVDIDSLGKGVRKFSMDMLTGNDAFNDLGIATRDASGNMRDTWDVMGDVADRFANMEDGAAKTAEAQRLFGKSGSDLIPMLNKGREGFEAWAEEAKNSGLIVSEEAVGNAKKFKGAQRDMEAAWEGLVYTVGLPVMTWLGENLPGWVDNGKAKLKEFGTAWDNLKKDLDGSNEGNSNAGAFFNQQKTNGPVSGIAQAINPTGQDPAQQFLDGLERIGNKVIDVSASVQRFASESSGTFMSIGTTVQNVLDPIWGTIQNIGVNFKNQLVDPLVGGLQTLYTYWDAASKETGKQIQWVWDKLVGLKDFIAGIPEALGGVIDWFEELPGSIMRAIGDLGSTLWNAGSNLIAGLWGGLKEKLGQVLSTVSGFAAPLVDAFKAAFGIASPAKVMIPIGEAMAQGIGAGFSIQFAQVLSQMEAWANQATHQLGFDDYGYDTILSYEEAVARFGASAIITDPNDPRLGPKGRVGDIAGAEAVVAGTPAAQRVVDARQQQIQVNLHMDGQQIATHLVNLEGASSSSAGWG